MTGTGELWVGANGLPLRQTFALEFPPDKDNYVSSAEITVDFSGFAPITMASGPGCVDKPPLRQIVSIGTPQNALSLLALAMALLVGGLCHPAAPLQSGLCRGGARGHPLHADHPAADHAARGRL